MRHLLLFLALLPSVGNAEIYTQKPTSPAFYPRFIVEGVCSAGGQNVYLRRASGNSSSASGNYLSYVVCKKSFVAGGYKISFIRGSAPFRSGDDGSPQNVLVGCTIENGMPVEFTYEWADFGNINHPALLGNPEDNLVFVQWRPGRNRTLQNRNLRKEITVEWRDAYGNAGFETLPPQGAMTTVNHERVTATWFTIPYRPDSCGNNN